MKKGLSIGFLTFFKNFFILYKGSRKLPFAGICF
jgi:hypothetical protein